VAEAIFPSTFIYKLAVYTDGNIPDTALQVYTVHTAVIGIGWIYMYCPGTPGVVHHSIAQDTLYCIKEIYKNRGPLKRKKSVGVNVIQQESLESTPQTI
jgi:hypothetical protein